MKKFLLRTALVLGLATSATAASYAATGDIFTYEGIRYQVRSEEEKTVAVIQGTTAYADTVVLPEKAVNGSTSYDVAIIGPNAFDLCTNLVAITFPASLKTIETAAFFNTTKLKSVTCVGTVPANIDSSPFASVIYTNGILHVPAGCWLAYQKEWNRFIYVNEPGTFSASVNGVNYDVMSPTSKYCRMRSANPKYSGDVTVPATVEINGTEYRIAEIGSYCFDGCADLTSVTFAEGLLAVNSYAMRKCNKLVNVKFPSTVQFFATGIFNACTGIKTVDMRCMATRVENVTFQNCTELETVYLPQGCKYLGASCFSGCKKLVTVENSQDIEVIMSGVFQDTPELNMVLPAGLTVLENTSFKNSGVTFTTYPVGLKVLNANVFYGCKNLKSVTFPRHLTTIGASALAYCTNLETVVFPQNGPATFGLSVLSNCPALKNVTLPQNITFLPAQIFYKDTSLRAVDIPESVIAFHNDVFNGCSNLQNFSLPSNTQSIAKGCFQACTSLTEMIFPPTVNLFGPQLFANCTNLERVKYTKPITLINSFTFSGCSKLKSIEGIDSVDTIANSAFVGCASLTSFTVPKNVYAIWNLAFKNCTGLETITLNENLDSIAKQAFTGCTALKTIVAYPATPPVLIENAFDDTTYNSAKLRVVNSNSMDAYKNATGWKKFLNIKLSVSDIFNDLEGIEGSYGYIKGPEEMMIYTLQGRRMNNYNLPAGIYIVIYGNRSQKVFVR